jgi:curved DNA-binding protein CbpA
MQRPVEPNDPDHYWELGGMNMHATAAEIRRAYLHLSMQHHPDKLPVGASDAKFKKVRVVLSWLT